MTFIGAFISGCSGPVLSTAERDFFARTNPWGLILFKRNCETPEQLKRLTGDFRDAVGRKNAPVFIDQEGGRVQRLGPPSNAWRRYPAARAYGDAFNASALAGLRAARNVGRLMAEDLIAAGITANCVPVLDVPQPGAHEIVGNRAYSDRIEAIMALARAHAAGFADGGVLPVIKHIPGHGRARADSHGLSALRRYGRCTDGDDGACGLHRDRQDRPRYALQEGDFFRHPQTDRLSRAADDG
jgi:beta-N-acetylhexosaminidase